MTQTSSKLDIAVLPYHHDSSILFASLKHLDAAVYLDSSAPYSKQGRYDLISAEPIELLTRTSANYTVDGECFFDEIKKHLDDCDFITGNPLQLPFIGGAIGYFNYDLGREIEKLPEKAEQDVLLPDAIVGIYDWAIIVDHEKQATTMVMQPTMKLALKENILRLLQQPALNTSHFSLNESFQSNMSKADYKYAFNQSHQYIHAGDCYQINLAQRFSAAYQGDSWQAYKRLRKTAGAPYSAYLRYDNAEILSFSPEQFIQLRHGQVSTAPIKGTRVRGSNKNQDNILANELIHSKKDQAENLMIVDLLRNDLGKTCIPGSIKVDKLFELQSFETVHHLVSTISGALDKQYHACDLLATCFPGGSITGAPKIRAMEIIEELEPHRRSIYCGSIAYISFDGQMDSNITIRTVLANNNKLHCWSGGGLVADSSCEAEYKESLQKVDKLLQALGNEPLIE